MVTRWQLWVPLAWSSGSAVSFQPRCTAASVMYPCSARWTA